MGKALSDRGVRIVGLYYDQDTDPDFGIKSVSAIQQEVAAKLGQLGNPYAFNIFDTYRDYSLDLGVTGAPETFLIDKQGIIRMHHIGDINPRVWDNKIAPVYNQMVAE
jgi:cytochrome c biogenesis protein CcmG/thiol:disulfide interchange protein DsbE